MDHATTNFKTIDEKGRVNLGREFAGRAVEVDVVEEDEELRVRFVQVVPARESWLWNNDKALASVRAGIEAAARHEFTDEPDDFEGALRQAAEIPDEDA